MMARPGFLDAPGPIALAHRGASADQPENTMAAFDAAVQLGYRYIETDVHLTKDGQLIAFHDDRLDRVTDAGGRISAVEWEMVRRARVNGREAIPLLAEILENWPDLFVNIDPKSDAAVGPLIALIQQMNAVNRVCIGSFSGARLKSVRNAWNNNICTSMGPADVLRLRLESLCLPGAGRLVGKYAASCVQVPPWYRGIRLIDRALIEKAHEKNLKVHAWTINEESEMHRLLNLGIDGIISDEAILLKSVFKAHNLWRE